MKSAGVASAAFATHSGWAAVVVLGLADGAVKVLSRTRLDMVDDQCPESKQPYHAVEALDLVSAARRMDSFRESAEAMALRGLRSLVDDTKERGHALTSLGVLESSSRKVGTLASVLASHALIHAADGIHFRDALSAAGARLGLTVHRTISRDLEKEAQAHFGAAAEPLREVVSNLGRTVGPPWGADQKLAALLALVLVSQHVGDRTHLLPSSSSGIRTLRGGR
jgi:hypothetical protein